LKLFDHLVDGGEQLVRHGEAEHPGSRGVDHQLILGRCLHQQVGRLRALEDAIHITGCTPVLFDKICAVGDQPASVDEGTLGVHRRQLVPGRKGDDQFAMNKRRRARPRPCPNEPPSRDGADREGCLQT
jgi:hypothetical protein